jgi:multidrug efflux system outer membrane protein
MLRHRSKINASMRNPQTLTDEFQVFQTLPSPAVVSKNSNCIRNCLIVLVVSALFAGCTVGANYKRPQVAVPPAWRTVDGESNSLSDLNWWQLFKDPTLQNLIRVALQNNKDLQVAFARVAEERALLGVARSAQFPQLDASARYKNQRLSESSFPPVDKLGVNPDMDLYRTDLDLSFEIDLWGRLRRATEAARAELLASEEVQRTVTMTLVSDVAQAYFELLELDSEVKIDRRTVESRRNSLNLVSHRYNDGLASELDVKRAEEELAATAGAVPDAERRIGQAENRLSILLGKNPGPIARGESLDSEVMPPEVPAGLPSALLERRPDILAAEQQLVAANARIGAAKAEFFPQISLTGAFGTESVSLSDFFTGPSRAWQAGPTVTLPIFHGGRLSANLHATEAREQQALIRYRQSIQQAFKEVEDALIFHSKAREVRIERERRVSAARQALALADLRYANGISSYLDVLDAQRQLFSAETDLAQITRDQLISVVQLYKALGGGWETQPSNGKASQP